MKKRHALWPIGLFIGVMMACTTTVHAATQTITPNQIDYTQPEIPNPLRGQYSFLSTDYAANAAPSGWPLQDAYARYTWRQVEPTQGNYNFSVIEDALDAVEARKGKFGFRIMPLCIDCGASQNNALPDYLNTRPTTWQYTSSGTTYSIPDWNDDFYLDRWEALMTALGNQFQDDPRLGYIDFGGYGTWGEQHTYPFSEEYPGPGGQNNATLASIQRIYDAVIDNFPNTFKGLNPTQMRDPDTQEISGPLSVAAVNYALRESMSTSLRRDCIGGGWWMQQATYLITDAAQTAAVSANTPPQYQPAERWKYAPMLSEWCNNISPGSDVNADPNARSSFSEGLTEVSDLHLSILSSGNWGGSPNLSAYPLAQQNAFITANKRAGYRYTVEQLSLPDEITAGDSLPISVNWRNANVAPTYNDWNVRYEVRDSGGTTVATQDASGLNLKALYPGQATSTNALTVATASLAPGDYTLAVRVSDANAYSVPMNLALTGREGSGSYALASFRVVAQAEGQTGGSQPAQPTAPTAAAQSQGALADTGSEIIPLIASGVALVAVPAAYAYRMYRRRIV